MEKIVETLIVVKLEKDHEKLSRMFKNIQKTKMHDKKHVFLLSLAKGLDSILIMGRGNDLSCIR